MKKLTALCMTLLLSGAMVKADDHKTWGDVGYAYFVEGPREANKSLCAIIMGGLGGGIPGLLMLNSVKLAKAPEKKILSAVGAVVIGNYVVKNGEQTIIDTLGKEKVGVAKTAAALALIGTLVPLVVEK